MRNTTTKNGRTARYVGELIGAHYGQMFAVMNPATGREYVMCVDKSGRSTDPYHSMQLPDPTEEMFS
jgi:hypothetical protein